MAKDHLRSVFIWFFLSRNGDKQIMHRSQNGRLVIQHRLTTPEIRQYNSCLHSKWNVIPNELEITIKENDHWENEIHNLR